MKTVLRRLRFCLHIILLFTCFCAASMAEETDYKEGTWGDNINWQLNSEGQLRISGEGRMNDLGFYSTDAWLLYRDQIKSVIIETGITDICSAAFKDCSFLKDVTIQEGLERIESNAFLNCSSLSRITIPSSVDSLYSYVFSGCNLLKSAGPSGSGCNIEFGWNETIPSSAFSSCKEIIDVIVPDGISIIDVSAFEGCTKLTNISLPNSLVRIGGSAFRNCSELNSIVFNKGLETIDYSAFCGCINLSDLIIPNGVTYIGDSAFFGCSNLSKVKIPSSITHMGTSVFSKCPLLKSVGPLGSDSNIEYGWKTQILKNAFNGCTSLVEVSFPSDISTIGDYAFCSCGELKNITLPSGISKVGIRAFDNCESLETVNLSTGLMSIGNYCFHNCYNLTNIKVPYTVQYIGDAAFYGCRNLAEIYIPDSVTNIGNKAFFGCRSLTHIELPNRITKIKDETFRGCIKLMSVKMDSVGTIGNMSFFGCIQLNKLALPVSLNTVGDMAFEECGNLSDIYYSGDSTQWNHIQIGESNEAIFNAKIHYQYKGFFTVSFDANGGTGAPSAQEKQFAQPLYLSERIPKRNRFIFIGWAETDKEGEPQYKPGGKYTNDEDVTLYAVWLSPDLILPSSLTAIEDEAFSGGAFSYVVLPDGAETIGWHAFADCPKLAYIYIPASVASIDENAFDGVEDLTIFGAPGSAADEYAGLHGFTFATQ